MRSRTFVLSLPPPSNDRQIVAMGGSGRFNLFIHQPNYSGSGDNYSTSGPADATTQPLRGARQR